jgi:transcriptional regulator with XRE-family HTH domain
MPASSPTNIEVGARIDLDHSTVSRIRRGQRRPSLASMLRIQRQYGWSLADQAGAIVSGNYGPDFERVLRAERAGLAE